MLLDIGARLGTHEILELIGAGGMGEVYKAKDHKLDRYVVVKVLRPELADDPERLRRFEQEARAASALNHPNIVTVHDLGEHEGAPYIVMEYVVGVTLREKLAGGPLPQDALARYVAQLAAGLAKAHQGGIVHRDLKPENIIISEDSFLRIVDFGLAKAVRTMEGGFRGIDDGQRCHDTGNDSRNGRLNGARTSEGPERRLSLGPVLVRRDRLRDGDRQTCLWPRDPSRDARRNLERRNRPRCQSHDLQKRCGAMSQQGT